MIVLIV